MGLENPCIFYGTYYHSTHSFVRCHEMREGLGLFQITLGRIVKYLVYSIGRSQRGSSSRDNHILRFLIHLSLVLAAFTL